jgi:hypothetical protein
MYAIGLRTGLVKEGREDVVFEKKQQNILSFGVSEPASIHTKDQKFFGPFFPKKDCLLRQAVISPNAACAAASRATGTR